jgi:hypothetical protein
MRLVRMISMFAGAAALGCGSSGSGSTAGDGGGSSLDGGGGDTGGDGSGGSHDDGGVCHIGDPCNTSGADPKCGSGANDTCNDLTNDGFPGGYCSYEPCSATALCPCGSCAHLGGEANACWKICNNEAECRAPDYGCFDISPLYTSGPSHKVCYLKTFACGSDADCPAIKPKCSTQDGGSGVCS